MRKPPPHMVGQVTADHEASYADPVRVRRGDAIFLTGRTEDWDGWRWIWVEAGGREGWAPDDLPDVPPPAGVGMARAARDYSAVELTARAGASVIAVERRHGWVWCIDENGDEGWLPSRRLAEEA